MISCISKSNEMFTRVTDFESNKRLSVHYLGSKLDGDSQVRIEVKTVCPNHSRSNLKIQTCGEASACYSSRLGEEGSYGSCSKSMAVLQVKSLIWHYVCYGKNMVQHQ